MRSVSMTSTDQWRRPVRAGGGEAASAPTNAAYLNARNARLSNSADPQMAVDIPYMTVDLLDLTPQDPLSLWSVGTYQVKVKAGKANVTEDQLNRLLKQMMASYPQALPVRGAQVALLGDNRLAVSTTVMKGLPLPLDLKLKVHVTDPQNLEVQIESARLFGLPVMWLIKLLGLQRFLPAFDPLSAKGSTLMVDLSKQDWVQGSLRQIDIQKGKLSVVLGDEPDPEVDPQLRSNNPNYCQVVAKGEVELDSAVLHDSSLVILDQSPTDPYSLNLWDKEGFARVQSGGLILTEDKLRAKLQGGQGGFKMEKFSLAGTDMVIEGSKSVLGFDVPVKFKLRMEATSSGELQLKPHDVKILGLGFGESLVEDAVAQVPGIRRQGSQLILDLRQSAGAEVPPIKEIKAGSRRIELVT